MVAHVGSQLVNNLLVAHVGSQLVDNMCCVLAPVQELLMAGPEGVHDAVRRVLHQAKPGQAAAQSKVGGLIGVWLAGACGEVSMHH